MSAGLSVAALATIPPDLIAWDLAARAVLTVIGAGAAFAVIGAGIGAAVGNAPAALTGTYLFMLGVLPLVSPPSRRSRRSSTRPARWSRSPSTAAPRHRSW